MRLEISRRAHLALKAMRVLTHAPGRVKGADLADEVGTSTAFLAQAVTPLVRKGWVQSEPGRSGGYTASPDNSDVTVLDVIEAVEGKTDEDVCVLRGMPCPEDDPCSVHAAWLAARKELMDHLAAAQVASLPAIGSSV